MAKLRDGLYVFLDRTHAGEVLADMLKVYHKGDALVLAIPAGGVPVAAVLAKKLCLRLDLLVVSKITLPWNSEAGYGAVAFDGTTVLNEGLMSRLDLSDQQIQNGLRQTKEKVARRLEVLRGQRPLPPTSGKKIILVDDGLASGFTMRAAVSALRSLQVRRLILAIPTAHKDAVEDLRRLVDALYCPNIRSGFSFAVADAYQQWSDVSDRQVAKILADFDDNSSELG